MPSNNKVLKLAQFFNQGIQQTQMRLCNLQFPTNCKWNWAGITGKGIPGIKKSQPLQMLHKTLPLTSTGTTFHISPHPVERPASSPYQGCSCICWLYLTALQRWNTFFHKINLIKTDIRDQHSTEMLDGILTVKTAVKDPFWHLRVVKIPQMLLFYSKFDVFS